jgi:hypothetical protein
MPRLLSLATLTLFAAATPLAALVQPQRRDLQEFRDPRLDAANIPQPIAALDGVTASLAAMDLAALGLPAERAMLDARSERWATLIDVRPLVPGDGVGNALAWEDVAAAAPRDEAALRAAIWEAFVAFLRDSAGPLRIEPGEVPSGRVTIHDEGALAQIWAPRVVDGVVVRGAGLTAVVSHGNLMLFGAERWGDVRVVTTPSISAQEAAIVVADHLQSRPAEARKPASLEIVPLAAGADLADIQPGRGYEYRLAWVLPVRVPGDAGSWEALVDAHSGELLAFQDLNHYATQRRVQGGVYPISNDGIPPDGIEQAGWPMPWTDLTVGPDTLFTDGGGNLGVCADGTVTTHLDGLFVSIFDNCGAINESSTGNVDLGTSGGDDCTVPPGHSAGDTHSARSGFFEVNQVKAQARGQLPANTWLQDQLTANMNINSSCNAFWNGSTINFYRSGGNCANTGEIAGVFDHEWGHGMDTFDAVPGTASPGSEGIADVYAALRLDTSCMGRGFFIAGNCGGYGDPCTMCDGVRDIDWAKHVSGQPHDIDWILANCGGEVHCVGHVNSEPIWDLITRDLPTAGLDHNTSLEIAARLTYIGGGNVSGWYTTTGNCQNTTGCGCGAGAGYLNYLAADDDDGSLANGTPHMTAIFAAFDRHQIACTSPTVQNGGCSPAQQAPSITGVDALDKGAIVHVDQPGGPTTDRYEVYRTDGVLGCNMGKVKVGEAVIPDGITFDFVDEGLQNGREYRYSVIGVGTNPLCRSPMGNCVAVTPVAGPNLFPGTGAAATDIALGDDDPFLDNCEEASVSFDITNNGTGTQNNVRIVAVVAVSHPNTIVTGMSVNGGAALASCATARGRVTFQPRDMAFDDTLEIRVSVTSDQLDPIVKSGTVRIAAAEGDLDPQASLTFDFETDTDGWEVLTGTFNRSNAGGGGNGTTWYEASSAFLDGQCDQIRSPVVVLNSNSTMSLYTSFEIEGFAGVWYDRANIGLFDLGTGERTPVNPDGGRMYNASGANGTCGTENQAGWADSMTAWASSSWSAGALQSAAFAGKLAQLHVYYGTDPAANGFGFHFDEITLTNFSLQVADAQSDVCGAPVLVFADGFESGSTAEWSQTVN